MEREIMKEPVRKIAFLVNKTELKMLEEASLMAGEAGVDESNVKKEKGGKYLVELSYDDLDELAGTIAHYANHADSDAEEERWDQLSERVENLIKLSEAMPTLAKKPIQKTKKPILENYIFDVWVWVGAEEDISQKIVRKIQIAGTKSLYNFAKVITQAFDFCFDHCFGFYDSLKRQETREAYELFVDLEQEGTPFARGVKKVKISQAFKFAGKKMIFLFDYGDGWQFHVELKEIRQADKWDLKPVILEKIGKAPLQYPPLEEDV
jgi:hypothetical protein